MHRGYIKLWRKIEDSPLHPSKRRGRDFTGYEAMIDLAMMAHGGDTPKKVMKGNQVIEIKRGQLDKTNRQLAERWRWAIGKVNSFLQHLKVEGFLSLNVNRWFTLITIENYELWNPRNERNVNGTRTEDERNVNTYNESNEYNENNDNSLVPSGEGTEKPKKEKKVFGRVSKEYLLAIHLYEEIKKNNPEHKPPNFQNWAGHVDKMIRLDKRTPDAIDFMIHWSQQDEFWHKNILSTEKLREQFDTLIPRAKEWWKKQQEEKRKKELHEMTF